MAESIVAASAEEENPATAKSDGATSTDMVAVEKSSSLPAGSDDVPNKEKKDNEENVKNVEVVSAPSPRRPRPAQPKKGILKPPPPPVKPGLTGKLRDALGSFNPKLFENALSTAPADAVQAIRGIRPGGAQGEANGAQTSSVLGDAVGGAAAMVGTWGGRFRTLIGANVPGGAVGSAASRSSDGRRGGSPTESTTAAVPMQAPTSTSTAAPSAKTGVTAPGTVTASTQLAPDTSKPLKRASFHLPSMTITYPISSSTPAWSDKNEEDRRKIEQSKAEELKAQSGRDYWTRDKLVSLYESACKGREETVRLGVRNAILASVPSPTSRTTVRQLHLTAAPVDSSATPSKQSSGPFKVDPMDRHACEALADVLCLDWGLDRLTLENGVLDGDDCLKPILHALLVSGSLPHLSLAGNKKLKPQSFRILSAYLRKAKALKYLDISETILDRRSVEYLSQALAVPKSRPDASTESLPLTVPSTANESKPLPNCPDETHVGESSSATANKGAAEVLHHEERPVFTPSAPLLREDAGLEGAASAVRTLRLDGCSLKAASLEILGTAIRHSEIQNLSLRRNKISNLGAVAVAVMMKDYPDGISVTSRTAATWDTPAAGSKKKPQSLSVLQAESLGEASSMSRESSMDSMDLKPKILGDVPLKPPPRHPPTHAAAPPTPAGRSHRTDAPSKRDTEPKTSMAIARQLKFLEGVETVGRLQTLDLKANDIRGGVNYIAQVLKRNRTLKVLNLSENRIDHLGLAALAEALKYNATLETLDLSQNPCCGPALDGVIALRDAVTVNTTLKRLFLAGTHLVTDTSIILAEYLPEARSLLHVDLSDNPGISAAGIMALSVALRGNNTIRCLDLTVPPNNSEIMDLCQPVLQCCIRNTEAAIAAKNGKLSPAAQDAIWAPLRNSSLVKSLREIEGAKAIAEVQKAVDTPAGMARRMVYGLKPDGVLKACEEVAEELQAYVASAGDVPKVTPLEKQDAQLLMERGKALLERVVDLVQETTEAERLERLLSLNDLLTPLLAQAQGALEQAAKRRPLSVETKPGDLASTPSPGRPVGNMRRHIRVPSMELTSPNFSITNSDDDDSDAEELAARSMGLTTPTRTAAGRKPGLTLDGIGLANSGFIKPAGDEDLLDEDMDVPPGVDVRVDSCPSPLERVNRDWMAEEGEIFRKGSKLGVAEEEEVEDKMDVTGDELKLQILDTEVERSPHKPIKVDDELNDLHELEEQDPVQE